MGSRNWRKAGAVGNWTPSEEDDEDDTGLKSLVAHYFTLWRCQQFVFMPVKHSKSNSALLDSIYYDAASITSQNSRSRGSNASSVREKSTTSDSEDDRTLTSGWVYFNFVRFRDFSLLTFAKIHNIRPRSLKWLDEFLGSFKKTK